MAKPSPTQRSLDLLRKEGYTVAITEHWNPWARIRQDLFGFIDILAMDEKHYGLLAVQTTSQTNLSHRLEKILPMETVKQWLLTGNRLEIHGWAIKGKRGERKTWQVTRREIFKSDVIPQKPSDDDDIPF